MGKVMEMIMGKGMEMEMQRGMTKIIKMGRRRSQRRKTQKRKSQKSNVMKPQIMTSCHHCHRVKNEGSAEKAPPASTRPLCVHPSAQKGSPRRTRSRRRVSLTVAADHVKPPAKVSS